jgi:phospholipase C
VYGPNGFFREFTGGSDDMPAEISCAYQRRVIDTNKITGNIELNITNLTLPNPITIQIKDHAYKSQDLTSVVGKAGSASAKTIVVLDLSNNSGWYDFSVKIPGHNNFEKRYAGHVETGKPATSDPAMGNVV